MNILVHTSNFPPVPGGIAAFLQHVCDQLSKRGHNVEVLAQSKHVTERAYDVQQPFPVYRYRLPGRMSAGVMIGQMVYHVRRQKSDVILQGLFTSSHGLGLVASRWLLRVPYTVLVHGFDLLNVFAASRADHWASRRVLDNAALMLANSEATKREIEGFGYPENRIRILNPAVDPRVFHPGVDTSQVCKRHGLDGRRVILTVSRLVAKKNHVTVLKALTQVVRKIPNIIYLIIGKGEEEVSLKRMVKDLNLKDNVVFAGYVEPENTPPYFAACDVFVMPSKTVGIDYESFGIVYAEANACGKPVIGGKSGGIADAVIDGVTGLLVDPESIDDIAKAIIRLLTDVEYAKQLGINGRKRVELELNWHVVGENVERVLEQVVSKNQSEYKG